MHMIEEFQFMMKTDHIKKIYFASTPEKINTHKAPNSCHTYCVCPDHSESRRVLFRHLYSFQHGTNYSVQGHSFTNLCVLL